jgi:type IV pilus assembly protein PilV
MMAIAVFAIGVSGIIAMQKVAAAANEHSKALSLATNVAHGWLDALKADSSLYTQAALLSNAQLLSQIGTNATNNGVWFRPAWNATKGIGAAFDGLGRPIDETSGDAANAQFCVHLRLTQLYPNSGMNVIRTEVRVFWPHADAVLAAPFCTAAGMAPAAVLAASTDFHFLYQVSAVRQQQP